MNGVEVIRQVNQSYAELLRRELGGEPLFTDPRSLGELRAEIIRQSRDSSGLLVPGSAGEYVNVFQYRVEKIADRLRDFWQTQASGYLDALRDSDRLTVYSENPWASAGTLALYFDTVVTMDRVAGMSNWSRHIGDNIIHAVMFLRELYKAVDYITASGDDPLLVVIPDSTVWDDANHPPPPKGYVDWAEYIAQQNCIAALNSFAKKRFDHGAIEFCLSSGDKAGRADLRDLFDTDGLRRFFNLRVEKEQDTAAGEELRRALRGEATVVSMTTVASLVRAAMGIFHHMARADVACQRVFADPLVDDDHFFRIKLELEGQRTADALQLEEERFVAKAMVSPEFNWLQGLPLDEVVQFRKQGGTDFLRSVFRESRKRIKHATLDDFGEVASEVERELATRLHDFKQEAEKHIQRHRRRMQLTSVSLSTTLALAILSIAAPPLAAIAVPSAAISALIGTASVRELVNEHLKGRRESELLGQRPAALLIKWRERTEGRNAQ